MWLEVKHANSKVHSLSFLYIFKHTQSNIYQKSRLLVPLSCLFKTNKINQKSKLLSPPPIAAGIKRGAML